MTAWWIVDTHTGQKWGHRLHPIHSGQDPWPDQADAQACAERWNTAARHPRYTVTKGDEM